MPEVNGWSLFCGFVAIVLAFASGIAIGAQATPPDGLVFWGSSIGCAILVLVGSLRSGNVDNRHSKD